ncbi:hypothetical protein GCM10017562_59790 [Streptomyces roseofulvus]|uniref:hypothetical protein n=1 Tax=Streptomyces roseofulvus TaxID=33902 RepID=UPI0031FD80A7
MTASTTLTKTYAKTPRSRVVPPSLKPVERPDADLLALVAEELRLGRFARPDQVFAHLKELASRYAAPAVPASLAPGHGYAPPVVPAGCVEEDPVEAFVRKIYAGGGLFFDQGNQRSAAALRERYRHNTHASAYRSALAAKGQDPELGPALYGAGTNDRAAEFAALGVRSWRSVYVVDESPVAPLVHALERHDRAEFVTVADAWLAANGAEEGVTVG